MRYVALLRGINLGGKTMVSMEELRRLFEDLGFENVRSYINSGNVAFDTRKTAEQKLVKRIEESIEKKFGRRFTVMVREQSSLPKIIAANPFEGEYRSHKEMHLLFLESEISEDQLAELRAAAPDNERFEASGREMYLHLPMGVAESLMGRGLIEKKLKVAVTARNWRTVEKLADL